MLEPSAKTDLRRAVAARRRARPAPDRDAVAVALCERVLSLPEVASADTVAAYASYPSEPGTGPLRAALRERGTTVLLPVLLADGDLDWVVDGDPATGLGRSAVARAEVVVCPATAVTAGGARLGKGGGSYDRALARVPASTLSVALVHDDEIVDDVPTQAHDVDVDVVVTPHRTLRRGRSAG